MSELVAFAGMGPLFEGAVLQRREWDKWDDEEVPFEDPLSRRREWDEWDDDSDHNP